MTHERIELTDAMTVAHTFIDLLTLGGYGPVAPRHLEILEIMAGSAREARDVIQATDCGFDGT